MTDAQHDHEHPDAEEVQSRQIPDSPLKRSEVESGNDNPEVDETDADASPETVDSYQKWEKDETN